MPCEELDIVWNNIKAEARALADCEPMLASFYHATLLKHENLGSALSYMLANKLASPQGMETLQIEQRRGVFIHRRVARAHRLNIAGGGGDHFRIGGVGLFHHFANGDRRLKATAIPRKFAFWHSV